MRRFATFAALFVLIVTAAPMLACVTGEAMTPQESACCRKMQGNCGDMAKMGCCNKKIATDAHPQLKTTNPPIVINFTFVDSITSFTRAIEPPSMSLLKAPEEHPLPGLLIVRITNLRI